MSYLLYDAVQLYFMKSRGYLIASHVLSAVIYFQRIDLAGNVAAIMDSIVFRASCACC